MKLGLKFDAINDNLPERIQQWGNNGRKVSADIYIDDQSFGIGEIVDGIEFLETGRNLSR